MQPTRIVVFTVIICTFFWYFPGILHSAEPTEKPDFVFLFHGLGRTKSAMWWLDLRLENAGFEVKKIGYHSLIDSPEEIKVDITEQVLSNMPDMDRTVHFVGHSLGGLLIRAFLDENNVENLGRVVLIGTPNQGTAVVDKYRDKWWMKIFGPTPRALGTDSTSFPFTIADPYYPVGIIAGIANWKNDSILPGKDDGVVPVESTKLNGMTDLITVKSGHTRLKWDKDVAEQTIEFLREGKFREDEPLIER